MSGTSGDSDSQTALTENLSETVNIANPPCTSSPYVEETLRSKRLYSRLISLLVKNSSRALEFVELKIYVVKLKKFYPFF